MDVPFYRLRVELNSEGLSFNYSGPEGPSRFRHAFNEEAVRDVAEKVFSCLIPSGTEPHKEDLEDAAGFLTDRLLDSELNDALARAEPAGSYLLLELDRELAWIPWELIRISKQFLCQRFSVARQLVKTRQELERAANRLRELRSGRGMLIACGDTRGLPAIEEKSAIEKEFTSLRVEYRGKLKAEDLLKELKRDYDILHFVGHGEYKEGAAGQTGTGWRCTDRTLTRANIQSVSNATFPFLIFANACDSARASIKSSEKYVTDLYQAFLSGGVPHYIGTIARVPADGSMLFARVFYRELAGGETIGKALWKARQESFRAPGPPIWAYYVHYGDPKHWLVSKERALTSVNEKTESSPTAQVTVTQMLEAFLRAQQAMGEQARRQQSEIDRLRAQQADADRRPRQFVRERVVGPVPGAIAQHFKDRVAQLRFLRKRLADENCRLVLVCGRGGMGKTALITKLLHDIQVDFTIQLDAATYEVNSIVYVVLSQSEFRSPDKIIELICRTLEPDPAAELRVKWQEKASLAEKLEFLFRRILGMRHHLIVLDNLEDVLDEENRIRDEFVDLREFVEKCIEYDHGARLVAIGRRTLVLSSPELEGRVGERRAELRLNEGLPEEEAISLLRELDTDGGLGIKDASDKVLREVTRQCHGVPRTLEAIVGILRQRRTWTLSRLLNDAAAFGRLTDNPACELYENLSPEERLVVQALAVYDRPVPAAAVRHLLPALAVDEILDALVRNYVVAYDRDSFSLHPLDQQHAYRQIPDGDGDYAKRSLHSRAAEFFREFRKPRQRWKRIDDLEPQLQRVHHLVRAGRYRRAFWRLDDIRAHLSAWGYHALLIELGSKLRGFLTDPRMEDENALNLGWSLMQLAQIRDAIELCESVLRGARDRNDRKIIISSLISLGVAYCGLFEYQKAMEHLEQALVVARELEDRDTEEVVLSDLGHVYARLGEIQKGSEYCEQALAMARERGHRVHEGDCLCLLGLMYVAMGQTSEASAYYRQALKIFQKTFARGDEAACFAHIGEAMAESDHFEQSVRFFQDGLAIARALGDKQEESRDLLGLGFAHHCLGKLFDARRYYQEAIALKVLQDSYSCYVMLGIVCLEEDKIEEAQGHFAHAVSLCRTILGKTPRLYDVLYMLALAELGSGQPGEAIATYWQALKVCSTKGVLKRALRNSKLLERSPKPVGGLPEVLELLQGEIDNTCSPAQFH